MKITI